MPATFSLDFQLALRCARSIAAHTLVIAVPLLAAWPDLIVSGLPNETAHCQSPPSSRTTVYSMPRYSIDRPIVLNAARALIADPRKVSNEFRAIHGHVRSVCRTSYGSRRRVARLNTETDRGVYWRIHVTRNATGKYETIVAKCEANFEISSYSVELGSP